MPSFHLVMALGRIADDLVHGHKFHNTSRQPVYSFYSIHIKVTGKRQKIYKQASSYLPRVN